MTRLLSRLSFGHVAQQLARLVGWSPIGKKLLLTGAEGPHAYVFDGLTGTVMSLANNEMLVRPDAGAPRGIADGTSIRVTARHEGWTFQSLMLTRIAVVAEAASESGANPIAIAIAAIVRR